MWAEDLATAHFAADEIERTEQPPATYVPNAAQTLALLESLRDVLGVPLTLTSLYRDPARNASTYGASPTSQHLTASAADVRPAGLSSRDVVERVADAELRGDMPAYSQLIVYPSTGEVHIGLGIGREQLARVDAAYVRVTTSADVPDTPAGTVLDVPEPPTETGQPDPSQNNGALLLLALAALTLVR